MPQPAVSACRLCAILLAATVAGDPAAAERAANRTPSEWLHAMDSAFRNLNYDGEFSYYVANHSRVRIQRRQGDRAVSVTMDVARDDKVATFRIVHMVIDGVERERIVHLGGPRREILRTGSQVSYLLPLGEESFAEDALPAGSPTRLFMRSQDLAANYRFDFSGRTQVMGRPAVCIQVNPLDHNRYGYLLWLDEETGLLLRSELRDAYGTHLEMVQFTSLRLGDSVSANSLEPNLSGVLVQPVSKDVADRPPPNVLHDWTVGWVPTGFRITDARVQDQARGGVHVMFNDGLATFSLFVEPAPETSAEGLISRTGATLVLSHNLAGERGGHLVTVVGEVPPETAQRIATSVRAR
ncbi:MAG: hypothetical protein F4Z28_17635 [Gammaproteobacteria bacterium]|nr:hypothetical protein [Gammaproteobacteria bacterium]